MAFALQLQEALHRLWEERWVRTSGHPGHQMLQQCLLIPGAAYQPLAVWDGAPNGRQGPCLQVTNASISEDAGGKGERGPAIP